MAITNRDRVGAALDHLKAGLAPFVERELTAAYKENTAAELKRLAGDDRAAASRPVVEWDAALLLKAMWEAWHGVFGKILGRADRTLVAELRDVRNRWAHQENFSGDDTYRALDSAGRLLAAISAPQADEIGKIKTELLRVRFEEQLRSEKRRSAGTAIESQVTGQLKPWREVITPHKDVASGRYEQAEFAADLWQVHLGEGADEYRNPAEFFRRTYLTESLTGLLIGALRRLSGEGGDPVVQLQTNFGGGKTHSMLALYHLFSGESAASLGIDHILKESEISKIPKATRVVLVGNKISPGSPTSKPDGTVVRTLWGELAWQLGGREAYEVVRADDEKATNPGDTLRALFAKYGPCLILIDEWVAYARQLHEQADLPAGTFETHFTFAQALTEAARGVRNCLLVVSLPASDTASSPHTQADDVEVGGQRGREALERLRNVIGRLESSWRPASAEEGFEIVRRRLFEPITEKEGFVSRDQVARAFYDLYRTQHQEFPPECRTSEYETRIKAAYPIHPEVFDRLYNDWSTLVKFQRTRGVLRLMAAVIHSLWSKGDRNPLILPSNIPLDDTRVRFELTRYLSDNWVPVIDKDIDGPNSLPLGLDGELPNLGKYHACRRVARTIYLGSAPTVGASNRGTEDRRIRLGCVMPGEPPAVFGDALRRLTSASTYLYQDGPRYWYSTQATVTKLAEDRAEVLKRDTDKVIRELEERLRRNLRDKGDFERVHPLPLSSQDVPDDLDARLVVLGVDHPYSKEPDSPALKFAREIFETRGNAPRLYRNTLVFLAVDGVRLQDLDEAVRRYIAWRSILDEREELNLDPHQVKQAENQLKAATDAVEVRIPEAYQWLIYPEQLKPDAPVEWKVTRVSGQDSLAARVSKKLRGEERLLSSFGGTMVKMELDKVPLWRGDHIPVKQLIEDFARYTYLPRLVSPSTLRDAIRSGVSLLTWQSDTFAYAESYDEKSGRYLGLRGGVIVPLVDPADPGLLVKPEVARKQMDAEAPLEEGSGASKLQAAATGGSPTSAVSGATSGEGERSKAPPRPKRYHGSVTLDPNRVGRDAGRIGEEIISHLSGLVGAELRVTLEIEATIPDGASEQVVRTITENGRTLKFTSHGFEEN